MRRALWLTLGLAALLAFAVAVAGLAELQGTVVIQVVGYEIAAQAGPALAALSVLVALLAITIAVVGGVWRGLERATLLRRAREARAAADLAHAGMLAVLAGDAATAARHLKQARRRSRDETLVLPLEAEVARLTGRTEAAEAALVKLIDAPDGELFAIRRLVALAQSAEDEDAATALLERATELRPGLAWIAEARLAIEAGAGDWAGIERALVEAKKTGALTPADNARRNAALALARSAAAAEAGDTAEARRQATAALSAAPGWPPAAAALARAWAALGKMRRAERVLAEAWQAGPHPTLADAFVDIAGALTSLARLQRARQVFGTRTDAPAYLALEAKLAHDAGDAAAATTAIETALAAQPSQGLYRLQAEIAERAGEADAATAALKAAAAAAADPTWQCSQCGSEAAAWHPTCGNCGAFDSMTWHTPKKMSQAPVPTAPDSESAVA